MPISWYESIPAILKKVEQLKPQSILDIGIGFGKYGVLLREVLELSDQRYHKDTWKLQIDGVEAFSGYQNPLHEHIYDCVYYENISELIERLPSYDVILMIDVLEHFEKDTGLTLLRTLVKLSKKALIISTPQYPSPQDEYLGNKFEEHKSRWTNVDLREFDFTADSVRIGTNSAQIFVIYPPQGTLTDNANVQYFLDFSTSRDKRLTIGYFLPPHNLTGGLKMLLEQMRHLHKKGHRIIAYFRGGEGEPVLPSWFNLKVSKEVLVPSNKSFLDYVDDSDIAIAGWLEQLPELAGAKIPIVYWEQGNEFIFGEHVSPEHRIYLQHCYSQSVALASVSPIVAKALETRFQRKSTVIPNGIDVDFYYPGSRPNNNVILLVGNPNLSFKGFDVAVRTLIRVWKAGYRFQVKWISPVNPQLDAIPFPFQIEYIVSPTQEELAELYRNSDIFLFTSWFEGFGMPPLEAMASGLPVVCTSCGGTEFYAVDGVNAMVRNPGDVEGLSENIIHLLNHPQERQKLSEAGRETAMKFSFANVINKLEQYLVYLVENKKG